MILLDTGLSSPPKVSVSVVILYYCYTHKTLQPGPTHERMRKAMNPAFAHGQLKRHTATFQFIGNKVRLTNHHRLLR